MTDNPNHCDSERLAQIRADVGNIAAALAPEPRDAIQGIVGFLIDQIASRDAALAEAKKDAERCDRRARALAEKERELREERALRLHNSENLRALDEAHDHALQERDAAREECERLRRVVAAARTCRDRIGVTEELDRELSAPEDPLPTPATSREPPEDEADEGPTPALLKGAALLKSFLPTPEQRHGEVDWGPDVGREIVSPPAPADLVERARKLWRSLGLIGTPASENIEMIAAALAAERAAERERCAQIAITWRGSADWRAPADIAAAIRAPSDQPWEHSNE